MTIYMLSMQDHSGFFRVFGYSTRELRDAARQTDPYPSTLETFEITVHEEPVIDWSKGGPGK